MQISTWVLFMFVDYWWIGGSSGVVSVFARKRRRLMGGIFLLGALLSGGCSPHAVEKVFFNDAEIEKILKTSAEYDFFADSCFLNPENKLPDFRAKLLNSYRSFLETENTKPIAMIDFFTADALPGTYHNTLVTDKYIIEVQYFPVTRSVKYKVLTADSSFYRLLQEKTDLITSPVTLCFFDPAKQSHLREEVKDIQEIRRSYLMTLWKNDIRFLYAAPAVVPHKELPLYPELEKGFAIYQLINRKIQEDKSDFLWAKSSGF